MSRVPTAWLTLALNRDLESPFERENPSFLHPFQSRQSDRIADISSEVNCCRCEA
jgi:hypothetical protein